MIRKLFSILLPALMLVACGGAPAGNENRQAVFTQIENDIRARLTEDTAFSPASLGDQLDTGGQAQSGEDSRARLDLQPDGTIIRLGPNTLFTLEELKDDPQGPLTRLNLALGQLWIILSSGSLEVETPYGTGAVRGSYMGIAFDSAQGATVTCLEGHCALSNPAGATELTNGQASSILDALQPPTPPRPLSENEIQEWLQNSPESEPFISPATGTPSALIGTGTPGGPPGTQTPNETPASYTLINNCDITWHWRFIGPQIITLEIPAGETLTGALPPGIYTALDWWRLGETHQTGAILPGGNLVVKGCPDR